MPALVQAMVLSAVLGIDLTPSSPNLPVFGSGPLTNLGDGRQALTNASAHLGWSLALPLAGRLVAGRKGMWIAGLSWLGYSLANEVFYHAPSNPGAHYPAEVRTDLMTRMVPCAAVLLWAAIHDRGGVSLKGGAPSLPPALPHPLAEAAVGPDDLVKAHDAAVIAAEDRLKTPQNERKGPQDSRAGEQTVARPRRSTDPLLGRGAIAGGADTPPTQKSDVH